MIRLMLTTGVLMWCAFVIWGEPLAPSESERLASIRALDTAKTQGSDATPVVDTAVAASPRLAVAPSPQATRAVAAQPQIGALPRLVGEPVLVSLIAPADTGAVATNDQPLEGAQDSAPTLVVEFVPDKYRVTGSRVNVRSGPSTSNRVVGTVSRDDIVQEAGGVSGRWIEIHNLETGVRGYMSGRFLEEL